MSDTHGDGLILDGFLCIALKRYYMKEKTVN